MSRARVVKLSPKGTQKPVSLHPRPSKPNNQNAAVPALPPGIHGAQVLGREGAGFAVRTLDGQIWAATLGDQVEEAFVEECLAERRTVLVSPSLDGVAILGAIQSRRTVVRDGHDTVRVEGRRVEIEAKDGISFKVGKSALRLDPQGNVRVVGQKMTMDVAELVRILAAMCELP
ncbi:MAG: hypothetical protein IPK82_35955 [Polyangiaceae bacterium]|nr:hypothetical protein [Polyangiaceae bacterium]